MASLRHSRVRHPSDIPPDLAAPPGPAAPRPVFRVPGEASYPPPPERRPRPPREHPYRGALLLAFACAAGIGLTWFAADEVLRGVRDAATWALPRAGITGRATASVALGAAGALALVAAWGRATHPRRAVRLADGRGRMAVDVIAGVLREAVEERADVRAAEVRVENRHRRGIRVRAWLRVTRDARIGEVLDAVDRAAIEVAERLAVALAEAPLVDVRYDELDLRVGRARD